MTGLPRSLKQLPPAVAQALHACTPLQRKFVALYCGRARGNGTLAAKLAGVKGVYATQAARASQLLREPPVRAAVEAWMTAFAMTAAELTAAITDLAHAHLGPFVRVTADGALEVKVRDDEAWEAYRHWLRGVECDPETGRVTKLLLHDSLRARTELAKILKLYSDAPQLTFHLYLQGLSDEELLAGLEARVGQMGHTTLLGVN